MLIEPYKDKSEQIFFLLYRPLPHALCYVFQMLKRVVAQLN